MKTSMSCVDHFQLLFTCGSSEDPDDNTIIDSIKIYGKTKDAFGWPQDEPSTSKILPFFCLHHCDVWKIAETTQYFLCLQIPKLRHRRSRLAPASVQINELLGTEAIPSLTFPRSPAKPPTHRYQAQVSTTHPSPLISLPQGSFWSFSQ